MKINVTMRTTIIEKFLEETEVTNFSQFVTIQDKSKIIENLIGNLPILMVNFLYYDPDIEKFRFFSFSRKSEILFCVIKEFINNGFRLQNLWWYKDYEGKKFNELPEWVKRGICETEIQYHSTLKNEIEMRNLEERYEGMNFEQFSKLK